MSVLESLRDALRRAADSHPGFTETAQAEALRQIQRELGGDRVKIPSAMPFRERIPFAVKERAYRDALTNMSNAEVCERHGISRATLYRLVKRGPKGG